jgi:hypothetical protein
VEIARSEPNEEHDNSQTGISQEQLLFDEHQEILTKVNGVKSKTKQYKSVILRNS